MSQPKIILVAGPTAAGKSALALYLARKNRGIIINADAMQIYAGLPILSAQPSAAEMLEIPHRLYGVLDAAVKSSVGSWLELAAGAVRKTMDAGYVPILVGGTGLYFTALLGGLAPIPSIPGDVREKTQALYDNLNEDKFRIELAKLDPETAARLAKNDRQRSIRAYEVALHTGKPLGYWHKEAAPSLVEGFDIEPHLLMPERDTLYAACDNRFAKMMAEGAVEETKQFLSRNLDTELPAMKTLGLREISAYLKNEITLDEAITQGQQATRNYAKRQMTWFRNQWTFN
jgi:tRNA dimethylallyltransferase